MKRDELIKACDEIITEVMDCAAVDGRVVGHANVIIKAMKAHSLATFCKQLLTQGVDGMSQEKAEKILETDIQRDGGLYCLGRYLAWSPGDKDAKLDAEFSADELEAIAWWMRNQPLQSIEGKG